MHTVTKVYTVECQNKIQSLSNRDIMIEKNRSGSRNDQSAQINQHQPVL